MKASMTIADELRHRIASGELLPGDPLPSENDLVESHGYSRPTVREALRILENEGLIRVRRGLKGGPEVRSLSIAKVAQPIGVYLQISDVPVSDVWAARDRIIASAVERLAEPGAVDLGRLEEQVETLVAHVGDVASFYLHMIATAEVAVELAGSATDHVVVAALRHVIEAELAAATAAAAEATRVGGEIPEAVAVQRDIAEGWRAVLRHGRAGRHRAARKAYEQQAAVLRAHFDELAAGTTVGESAAVSPEERATLHAVRMSSRRGGPGD